MNLASTPAPEIPVGAVAEIDPVEIERRKAKRRESLRRNRDERERLIRAVPRASIVMKTATSKDRHPYIAVGEWLRHSSLSPLARLVFLAIARMMNKKPGRDGKYRACPGLKRLRRETGLSLNAVKRYLRELCGGPNAVLVQTHERMMLGNRERKPASFVYVLLLDPPGPFPIASATGAIDPAALTDTPAELRRLLEALSATADSGVTGPLHEVAAMELFLRAADPDAGRFGGDATLLAEAVNAKVREHIDAGFDAASALKATIRASLRHVYDRAYDREGVGITA